MPLQTDITLKPLRGSVVAVGGGSTPNLSISGFLGKFPRVMASATITVGGTATDDDEITINLNLGLLPGGKVSKTIVVASDTLISLAQKNAKELADDAVLQSYGVVVYSLGAIVTVKWPGALGNKVTGTNALSGGATATITHSNSGAFTGGSGPVIPYENFNFAFNGQGHQFEAGKPKLIGGDFISALITDKAPIM